MKIDVHVHTSEVSGCGQLPGAEMARLYRQAGYDAIVITDHLIAGMHQEMSARERSDWYLSGYRAAREAGEKIGLTVLLGAEVRFYGGNEDFLLYGVREGDIAWVFEQLDADMRLEQFYPLVKASGRLLLIQAHPFREPLRHAPTELLDGVEVYNASNFNHANHNDLALEYARGARAGFIQTSGSDAHMERQVAHGGLIAQRVIATEDELVQWLRSCPTPQRIEN